MHNVVFLCQCSSLCTTVDEIQDTSHILFTTCCRNAPAPQAVPALLQDLMHHSLFSLEVTRLLELNNVRVYIGSNCTCAYVKVPVAQWSSETLQEIQVALIEFLLYMDLPCWAIICCILVMSLEEQSHHRDSCVYCICCIVVVQICAQNPFGRHVSIYFLQVFGKM